VLVAAAPTPASADSGVINSAGNDCSAYWDSDGNAFFIRDNAGGDDNDYCYVDYGATQAQAAGSSARRLTIPQDSSIGNFQRRVPDLSGIGDQIYFKVCEERENDPDLCSNASGYKK